MLGVVARAVHLAREKNKKCLTLSYFKQIVISDFVISARAYEISEVSDPSVEVLVFQVIEI